MPPNIVLVAMQIHDVVVYAKGDECFLDPDPIRGGPYLEQFGELRPQVVHYFLASIHSLLDPGFRVEVGALRIDYHPLLVNLFGLIKLLKLGQSSVSLGLVQHRLLHHRNLGVKHVVLER